MSTTAQNYKRYYKIIEFAPSKFKIVSWHTYYELQVTRKATFWRKGENEIKEISEEIGRINPENYFHLVNPNNGKWPNAYEYFTDIAAAEKFLAELIIYIKEYPRDVKVVQI